MQRTLQHVDHPKLVLWPLISGPANARFVVHNKYLVLINLFALSIYLVKWSLKMTRSACCASPLDEVMAQELTGQFSLRKTPLPGRMLPQEFTPFHKRIFLSGTSDDSKLSAI